MSVSTDSSSLPSQIAKLVRDPSSKAPVEMYITDYTTNDTFFEYFEKTHYKWYERKDGSVRNAPLGKKIARVTCYDEALVELVTRASDAPRKKEKNQLPRLQEGSVIFLRNARCKGDQMGRHEIVVHGDTERRAGGHFNLLTESHNTPYSGQYAAQVHELRR